MTTLAAAPWGNRIIGTGTVRADQLQANEGNWRIHPEFQQQQLSTTLQKIGFIQTVIVNRRTAPAWGPSRGVETVLDGHLRVALSLSRGDDTPVPVSYVDLDPAEEAWALATFDPIAALAVADREKLDELIAGMDADDAALARVLHAEKASASKVVSFDAVERHEIVVECGSAAAQVALLARLRDEGYTCRTQ